MSVEPVAPTESGAVFDPNVQRIKNYQAAMARGERETAVTVFEPEVQYIVPGDNRLSGHFVGPDGVMDYFGKLMALTGGTYRITEMRWLVNGEKVLLETSNYAEINGKSLTWNEGLLFEFHNGRKRRIELFQADQKAVDAFLG